MKLERIEVESPKVIFSFLIDDLKVAQPSPDGEDEVLIHRDQIKDMTLDLTYGYLSFTFKNDARLVIMRGILSDKYTYTVKGELDRKDVFEVVIEAQVELFQVCDGVFLRIRSI